MSAQNSLPTKMTSGTVRRRSSLDEDTQALETQGSTPQKRARLQLGDDDDDNPEPEPGLESGDEPDDYKLMQEYHNLENDFAKSRAEMLRTGNIDIAISSMHFVDSLFTKSFASNRQRAGADSALSARGSNNRLLAYDSRAIVNISELTDLSVKNLKLGAISALVNLTDIIGFCKRYMLKEYFTSNNIVEERVDTTQLQREDDRGRENSASDNENEGTNTGTDTDNLISDQNDRLKQHQIRRRYLSQFDRYDRFTQFNWFKMGMLYESLSKNPSSVDHFLGPLLIEKKVRAPMARRAARFAEVGRLSTADKVTVNDLTTNQDKTTPELVRRCYKKLLKKVGKDNSVSLFQCVVDPNSFAKTVENLFYISFLIKDGRLILEKDLDRGIPMLKIKETAKDADKNRQDIQRQKENEFKQNHIIFQIDIPTWRKIIEKFQITSSFMDD